MTWLSLLLAALAAARTFRLLAVDSITEPLRTLVYRGPAWLTLLWACPFCLGWWVTLGWVLTGYLWAGTMAWTVLAGSLAASYLSGHLNSRLDT